MGRVTAEVRALLQERQERRKKALDAHRRDVWFAVGDKVLLNTKHTPLPSSSLLEGPSRSLRAQRPIPTSPEHPSHVVHLP